MIYSIIPTIKKTKNSYIRGFTIVELLIVIVVIAVLASISVVAYNGIIRRGLKIIRQLQLPNAFYKAIKMYEIDNGEVPHSGLDSCLGENYPWDFDSSDSGDNQCRYASFSYYKIKGTINNDLKQYLNEQLPAPSMQTIGNSGLWSRGITYITGVVGGNIAMLVTLKDTTTCPQISGQAAYSQNSGFGNGVTCNYYLGIRLR